jgi:formylglycine-generating enzyme required for sulfatase activity
VTVTVERVSLWTVLAVVVLLSLGLTACGPTPTPVPPADTPTPVPPTDTPIPVPPTGTPTPVPPTDTPTPVPPTDTPTPVPPTDTPTPSAPLDMVYVSASEFIMGSSDSDPEAEDDEKPQHTVYLDAYYMDRTEVTNDQYRKCVEAGACSQPHNTDGYNDPNRAEHPVVWVDWNQASAYCQWAGKRLPTEAEWEKTARGTDGRVYPWGNEWDGSKLNFCDKNCPSEWKYDTSLDDGYAESAPVGSYPVGASPYGCMDMAGNVWEWVADWYIPDYYSQSPERNPPGPDVSVYRILRGGSWRNGRYGVRSANRIRRDPDLTYTDIGFRCVWSFQLADTQTPMPPTDTSPLVPTAPPPTDTPTPVASVASGPCCEPLQPGKGMLWFENFAAFEGAASLGSERYPIGKRQYEAGEAGPTGCLCLQVDPGSHEITVADRWSSPRWETKLWIDVVAGQIWHLPIVGIAGRSETEGAKVEPYLLSQ